MKRAVILHGTDASPEHNWFPWMKDVLERHGYKVWVPELPDNHTPNRKTYNDYLFGSDWDFTDNLVIGHSSGAVSILNLLEDARCPHINTAVLVGAWSHTDETDLDHEQFKDLFPQSGFNFSYINDKADHFVFIHGDDDPYCPLNQAKWLAEAIGVDVIIVPQGHHLGEKFTELPQLTKALEERKLL